MQNKRNAKSSPQRPGRGAQQVRIIGGQWKRTPLPVLDAEGLRPTPDRVRETAFNWLNHLLDGAWTDVRCLDLFAGTGALGFEAASRGAADVLMVEENPGAVKQLEANKLKLNAQQVRIRRGDALSVMRQLARDTAAQQNQCFDLIFLDPPYHRDWLVKILPLCKQLLTQTGMVYAEAEVALDSNAPPEWLEGWEVIRADKAGVVFYHLLQRNSMADFQA